MTIDSNEVIEGELIETNEDQCVISSKREACSLDDAYIFNYTNNPKAGKTQALRDAGYDGQYISQEAHRIHNRLRPIINKQLSELTQDIGNLSRQQLESILSADLSDIGAANMLGAIKIGFDYSGNKPKLDEVEAKPRPAINEVHRRIETLQKQIRLTSNKALPTAPDNTPD